MNHAQGRRYGRMARGAWTRQVSTTGGQLVALVVACWLIGSITHKPYAGWVGAGIGLALTVGIPIWEALDEWLLTVSLWTKVRLGAVGGAIGAAAILEPWALVPMGAGLAWWAWRALRRWWARWRWWRWYRPTFFEYVEPLHERLTMGQGAPLAVLADADPLAYIDVQPEMLEAEGGIVITFPRGPIPDETKKNAVLAQTVTTLGLRDYRPEWRFEGTDRWLRLLSKERSAPDLVPFDDEFKRLMEAAPIHRKLVGRTAGDRPFYVDRKAENPHTLLTCPTGWGKTTAVGIELADTLHKGGEGVCLDIKYGSMRWAYDLPGVTYARTVEEIHRILVNQVGPELLRRREVLGATHWAEEPQFTPIFFVIEEMNSLIEELRDYWVEERARLKAEAKANGETIDLSTKSPAIKVYKQIGFMGRQLCMYMTVISQRGEANALGGSGPRGQLGNVVLGWPTKADWNMHAPQHPYVPHNNHPGRAHVVRGKHINEVQYVKASAAELRDWATSGLAPATTLSQPSHASGVSAHQGGGVAHVLAHPTLQAVPDEPERPGVTLREASSDYGEDGGLIPENLGQLRTESKRDPKFPKPLADADGVLLTDPSTGAHLYDPEDISVWSIERRANRKRRAQ